MITTIKRNPNRKKMFEAETDFIIDRCIFCESKNIVFVGAHFNEVECEECEAKFIPQDIQRFANKGIIEIMEVE